jgi:hypothetical protein
MLSFVSPLDFRHLMFRKDIDCSILSIPPFYIMDKRVFSEGI